MRDRYEAQEVYFRDLAICFDTQHRFPFPEDARNLSMRETMRLILVRAADLYRRSGDKTRWMEAVEGRRALEVPA